MKPAANVKGENEGWKVHDRAQSFVLCSHTINGSLPASHGPSIALRTRAWPLDELHYRKPAFLLVSCLDTTQNLLCFVHGQGQTEANKNMEEGILSGFITIFSVSNLL